MIQMQKSHEERSCDPLDIKLTDYPLAGTGVGSAHKQNKPQQKAGANVSIILGHFQKCLT